MGSPASTCTRKGGTKAMLMSTLPEANAGYGSTPPMSTYSRSVKPSATSNSRATYCGAMQIPGMRVMRSFGVSGGGSAAITSRPTPRSPAVADSVRPPTNSRRLDLPRWSLMGTSFAERLNRESDLDGKPRALRMTPWPTVWCVPVRITPTLTGRGERMRASGPVERELDGITRPTLSGVANWCCATRAHNSTANRKAANAASRCRLEYDFQRPSLGLEDVLLLPEQTVVRPQDAIDNKAIALQADHALVGGS